MRALPPAVAALIVPALAAAIAAVALAELPRAVGGTKPRKPLAPAAIEPAYVRLLMPFAAGRHDSNPVWSPTGDKLAFERARGDNKEIVIARPDGGIVQNIHHQSAPVTGESRFFFPGVVEETSYNAGISWSPNGEQFVFMSNAGEGNYDVYLRETGGRTTRLTANKEKDGHAHWSPVQDRIAFVSGRGGQGNVYVFDLATRSTAALTGGGKSYFYPQWSPDGTRLAVIHGTNDDHDVAVLEPARKPPAPARYLTTWTHDDLRPVWSPDGRRIAFYTNYNDAGDPKTWAIAVIAADGSDPTAGEGLKARIVATQVVPDIERGPAWMPDSRRIVYVRNERQAYHPLYVVDVDTRKNLLLRTDTLINHDVACSRNGVIAFRAQVDQWDQIFLAELPEKKIGVTP